MQGLKEVRLEDVIAQLAKRVESLEKQNGELKQNSVNVSEIADVRNRIADLESFAKKVGDRSDFSDLQERGSNKSSYSSIKIKIPNGTCDTKVTDFSAWVEGLWSYDSGYLIVKRKNSDDRHRLEAKISV